MRQYRLWGSSVELTSGLGLRRMKVDEGSAPPMGPPPQYVSHTHKRMQDEDGGNHVVFWVSDDQVSLLLRQPRVTTERKLIPYLQTRLRRVAIIWSCGC